MLIYLVCEDVDQGYKVHSVWEKEEKAERQRIVLANGYTSPHKLLDYRHFFIEAREVKE